MDRAPILLVGLCYQIVPGKTERKQFENLTVLKIWGISESHNGKYHLHKKNRKRESTVLSQGNLGLDITNFNGRYQIWPLGEYLAGGVLADVL